MSRPGALLGWCVPDLAFATACVTLFYCLFLFQGYQKLFRDSDAGWHIRTGEAILATGTLPRTDPYSFTRGGQPWFAWEWLADAGVGGIHRAFGLRGVAVFYAAAISAGVWLWFRLHWALGGNFPIAEFGISQMLHANPGCYAEKDDDQAPEAVLPDILHQRKSCCHPAGAIRSEEHTSELQSLR